MIDGPGVMASGFIVTVGIVTNSLRGFPQHRYFEEAFQRKAEL